MKIGIFRGTVKVEADACSTFTGTCKGGWLREEVPKMWRVVTKFKENIKICADTSNHKNKRDLTNKRIDVIWEEQTRLMVPSQIPEKAKDKSGADRGGCCHADAECGGLTL